MRSNASTWKKCVSFGIALLTADVACADLLAPKLDAHDAIAQINSLDTKGGVSAQFWVTIDDQIFNAWAKEGAIRNLKPALQVKRNIPVYLALFLANPGIRTVIRTTGKPRLYSDVTFDTYLVSPTGILSLISKQRVGWKGAPPSPGLVYLAKDRGLLSFAAIDPIGEYNILVIIHDNIRKVDMRLARKLDLVD